MEEIEEIVESPKTTVRITPRQLFVDILAILNFERGVFYSLREMALRPYKATQEYLYGDRKKHANPLRLLFFSSAIATIVTVGLMDMQNGLVSFDTGNPSTEQAQTINEGGTVEGNTSDALTQEEIDRKKEIEERLQLAIKHFMQRNMNLMFLVSAPVAALWCALFFRKRGFNIAEHFVINCFLIALVNTLSILGAGFTFLWSDTSTLLVLLAFLLGIYFYMRVYSSVNILGFIKGVFINIISIFIITIVFLGLIILHIFRNSTELGLDEFTSQL